MSSIRLSMLAALLLLTPTAHADLIGEYTVADGQRLVLSYRDDQHIRVRMGAGQLLLVNGDRTLLVTEQGGSRIALDLEQMGALLGMAGQGRVSVPDAGSVNIQATGRAETVAGYEGEWYTIDDGNNRYRAVLTDAGEVVELTRAFAQIAARLGKLLGPEQAGKLQQLMDEAMQRGPGGVLRQADQFELTGISRRERPLTDYQLPDGVPLMSLPGMR